MFSLKYKTYLLLACLFGALFIIFTLLELQGFLISFNKFIDQTLPLTQSGFLYHISRFLAYLYVPVVVIIFLLFFRFVLFGQKYKAFMLFTSFSGVINAEAILKPIFKVPCPVTYFGRAIADRELFGLLNVLQSVGLAEACYPSGHVTSYLVFCGYLAYLVSKHRTRKWLRFTILGILFGTILLIGPSRLYLHLHWFSDVIGGYLFGLSLLLFIISLHRYVEEKKS